MIFFKRIWIKAIKMSNWTLFFAMFSLILFSSFFMYYLEPSVFISPFEGLWWTMTTVVTVGYGDVSPTTVGGKIFAMFLYVIGIGLMTVVIGKIIEALSYRKRLKEEGKLQISEKNHIILVNWSKRAEIALQELLQTFTNIHIVIIDEYLEKSPYLHERVDFVSGDPTVEDTMLRANLLESKSIMVFAQDGTKRPSEADGVTLLVASVLEEVGRKYNKNIYTICEVLDSKHIIAFKHANVEEFITPNDTAARLAARSMLFNGSSEVIRQLTSHEGYDLYHVPKNINWVTFRDASQDLSSKGAILVSNHNDFSILSNLDTAIPPNAKLFIICDEKTYDLIK
ncbi:ion transporter [Cytobacillus suaedae]|nr:ion transporter [Cytobacillus suaedae]